MADVKVTICGIEFPNPVWRAPGYPLQISYPPSPEACSTPSFGPSTAIGTLSIGSCPNSEILEFQ
jgi:dihydroorotate dehydrogenase